jgi:hypothetical protein
MQLSRQADRRVQSARHEREQSIADKTSLSRKMGKGFSHQSAGPARNPFKAKHADDGNSGARLDRTGLKPDRDEKPRTA